MRHRGRCPRRSRAGARPSPVAERPTGRPRCTGATAARRRRSPRDRATCPLALPDLALQREGALGARLEGHPARAARARDELRAASAVDDRAGEAAYPASRGMGIAPIRARSLRNLRSQTLAPPDPALPPDPASLSPERHNSDGTSSCTAVPPGGAKLSVIRFLAGSTEKTLASRVTTTSWAGRAKGVETLPSVDGKDRSADGMTLQDARTIAGVRRRSTTVPTRREHRMDGRLSNVARPLSTKKL